MVGEAPPGARRVLVTGGSGFIGTNVVGFYEREGSAVLNVDVTRPRNPALGPSWQPLDILDADGLANTMRSFAPTLVIHLAARTDLDGRSIADYAVNTRGVQHLLTAVASTRTVERVIFASSRLVCRIGHAPAHDEDYCPTTAYGASKVAGEQIVRRANLDTAWVIVRPTSIWGPWFDAPYRDFFESIARGRYFHVSGVDPLKSFGFIGNAVYQIHHLAVAPPELVHGRTLYLADYDPVQVRQLADTIQTALGAPRIRTVPLFVLRMMAAVGDGLARLGWRRVPLTRFRLANLIADMVYDLNPLNELAGPVPYSVDEGVALTVNWLREQGR